jgi:hypothetical protein
LLSALGVVAAVGCAVGSTEEDLTTSALQSSPAEAGADASRLPPRPDASSPDDGGAGVDAGKPDGGSDAGTVTGTCASPNVCAGATDLGSMSGDTGADVKSVQGSGSQWLKVRVTEDDSGIFGVRMLFNAELTSPPGTNFDLFVYIPGDTSSLECSAVTRSSTSASGVDTLAAEWGEGSGFANGSDDDRNVTVEVRWVSGTCAPGSKWALTLRGN